MSRSEEYLALCMLDAIEDANIAGVQLLLVKHSANPNTIVLAKDVAPMHLVIGADDESFAAKATSLMLEHGGDANLPTVEQLLTPLHVACNLGRVTILRMLLKAGGNVELQDEEGRTPIQHAIDEGHYEALEAIQNHVFEKKMERKRQQLLLEQQRQLNENNLLLPATLLNPATSLKVLEERAFTPNKIHYNFDATSPYYVNITHRRKDRFKTLFSEDINCNVENILPAEAIIMPSNESFPSDTEKRVEQQPDCTVEVPNSTNLFELTKASRRTIIDETFVTAPDEQNPLEIIVKPVISEMHLETVEMNKPEATLEGFETKTEHDPSVHELDECKGELDAAGDTVVIQISEEYIHSDDEAGVMFREKKMTNTASIRTISEDGREIISAQKLNYPPSVTGRTASLTSVSTALTLPPLDYDTDVLRAELTTFAPSGTIGKRGRCDGFEHRIVEQQCLEQEMASEFQSSTAKAVRNFREGHLKKSFIYLLLDPRISNNLPAQQTLLEPLELWKRFLSSVFYVGKGKSSRPYCHLYDAMKLYHHKKCRSADDCDRNVGDLMVAAETVVFRCSEEECVNKGVVCLHIFHNIMPAEAYTREAAIIDAFGLHNLTNLKRGDYYSTCLSWPMKKRKQLGILLLYKAMLIHLAEGETQLLPNDL
uniref:ANK_REP_REGION domain-containing protein n=1 Tax=Anopheles funestus TaxID=62324 RepID=A0A182REC8_ANOFN